MARHSSHIPLACNVACVGLLQVPTCPDGHPHLYGPPLDHLAGHFPLQQPLMGRLVPQAINMWMGCAAEGGPTSFMASLSACSVMSFSILQELPILCPFMWFYCFTQELPCPSMSGPQGYDSCSLAGDGFFLNTSSLCTPSSGSKLLWLSPRRHCLIKTTWRMLYPHDGEIYLSTGLLYVCTK
jgi:hypothetical protein